MNKKNEDFQWSTTVIMSFDLQDETVPHVKTEHKLKKQRGGLPLGFTFPSLLKVYGEPSTESKV
jgi:hypothetical protein